MLEGTHFETYNAGILMRKSVLGNGHVNRSLEQVSDFSRPAQELVTEYAWGGIWTRPALDLKTRSMLNLAMLTALNRPHELAIHVRGAVANGSLKARSKKCCFSPWCTAGLQLPWTRFA